jgi:hypothetical protein
MRLARSAADAARRDLAKLKVAFVGHSAAISLFFFMTRRDIFFGSLLAACVVAHAAEPASLEDRLRALELKVDTLQQENTALRRQLGAPEPVAKPHGAGEPAAAAVVPIPSGQESRVVIGGFTQMQAEFGGVGDARFAGAGDRIYARRARLSLGGSFAEHFEFRIDGEFGAASTTPTTGIRAQANELLLGWNRYPGASVRVGQLKPAFSAELLAIEYKGPLIERSFGAERMGDARQVGVAVNGDFLGQRAGYVVFVGNGSGSNSSANDNRKFLQTAHVYAVAFDSPTAGKLTVGADALHSVDAGIAKLGPGFDSVPGGALDNLFVGTRDGWGLDATWRAGLAEVSTELLRVRYRPLNAIPARSFDAESWQITAGYFVLPRQVQAAVRFEHFDPDTARAGDSTNNWMTGLTYFLKGEDLRLMVDYLFGHAAGQLGDQGRVLTRFQIVY